MEISGRSTRYKRIVEGKLESNRKAKPGTPQYEAVKRHIIATAIDLMAEKGFSKLRFEELAERVGCVRTTIYRYFDSKQELLREVMLALMHEIAEDIIQQTADTKRLIRKLQGCRETFRMTTGPGRGLPSDFA